MRNFLLVLFILASQLVFSQSFRKKLELGVVIGTTHCLCDVSGNSFIKKDLGAISDFQYLQAGLAAGTTLRYQFSRLLAIRGNINYAQARGNDSQSNEVGNKGRNLSFATNIYEVTSTLEFPLIFQSSAVSRYVKSKRGRNESKFYGFLGIGFLYFNPTATYKGAVYDLQPLATEGVKYSKYTLSIPAGLGYSYSWARKYKVAIEIGFRKIFTDYIDDISDKYIEPAVLRQNNPGNGDIAVALANRATEGGDPFKEGYGNYLPGQKRGNPKNNDFLIISTVQFNYILNAKRRSHRAKF